MKSICAIVFASAVWFMGTMPSANASPYTSLTVFGDSLSDGGNVFAVTRGYPPPPYDQRFSNGPVAVERLASNLGLALTPSSLGGSNYAFGGARTGQGNVYIPALSETGVLESRQVTGFVSGHTLGPSNLVVLWAGVDELAASTNAGDVAVAAQNLGLAVQALYGVGARSIMLPNMMDIGLTPFGLVRGSTQGTLVSSVFNSLLHAQVGLLEASNPGLDIIEFDTFGTLQSLIANPSAFGIVDTTHPCFDTTTQIVCANPNEYLYWDDLHPTARIHQILGDAFTATAVPEPPMTELIAVALVSLVVARRSASQVAR